MKKSLRASGNTEPVHKLLHVVLQIITHCETDGKTFQSSCVCTHSPQLDCCEPSSSSNLWLSQQKVCGNPHYVLPSRSPTSNTSPPPPSPPPPLSLNLLYSSFLFIVLRTAFLRTRRLVLLAYFLRCTSSSPSSPT